MKKDSLPLTQHCKYTIQQEANCVEVIIIEGRRKSYKWINTVASI